MTLGFVHCRSSQGFFILWAPPNLGLSRQYLHRPQSSLVQARHSPQRILRVPGSAFFRFRCPGAFFMASAAFLAARAAAFSALIRAFSSTTLRFSASTVFRRSSTTRRSSSNRFCAASAAVRASASARSLASRSSLAASVCSHGSSRSQSHLSRSLTRGGKSPRHSFLDGTYRCSSPDRRWRVRVQTTRSPSVRSGRVLASVYGAVGVSV
mmetsp:Transcript_29166/g.84813  ORF Transcript_29166/g.84813 Transcript_29166/m.84813 type:complete len:210 (+) Transcript_29166:216-845(+)